MHVFGRAQGDTYWNVQCPTCKLRPDEALRAEARMLEAADVIEHVEDEAVHVEDEAVLDPVPPGQADPEAPVQRYLYLIVKVHSSGCCHRMLPPATWSLCVLQ